MSCATSVFEKRDAEFGDADTGVEETSVRKIYLLRDLVSVYLLKI